MCTHEHVKAHTCMDTQTHKDTPPYSMHIYMHKHAHRHVMCTPSDADTCAHTHIQGSEVPKGKMFSKHKRLIVALHTEAPEMT